MTFFWIVFGFVILQRLLEVVYAKSNERLMKQQGAIEAGASHYKWIVLLHVLFFVSLLIEVVVTGADRAGAWIFFLAVFIVAQVLRVWALASLGRFWNTKILVLPGADKVKSGPYRWIPHPNYVVVALEILSLPLIFGAWRTALLFTIANALLLLLVRIPAEEKALQQLKG
ncbi:isoprenylcysteine carboxylmethyltransferase family protein [Planococcus sp. N028]|uniref:Isoprenylcysteine carboxylmethyltransferase family protein n=1 Tax=Planococcus shixiaomingii TaxID=3058393 RepID=A0ABT8N5R7_9BACL|nr:MULTISPECIES: isoprenylcysteine carboxylmethyltransferase family protein [unclassified Planococcus (in: firmicutes)]MDN7243225.1 isoprenylcysteine carboxylmethyltransferase family protein [Planococcus sp. N028]WKA55168.1 isoprenylcysteine carboxylmethyltransferase family protein [Planococcus sp. N022]